MNKRKNKTSSSSSSDEYIDIEDKQVYDRILCRNMFCNHKKSNKKTKNLINYDKITSIDELIVLGKSFHCKNNLMYKNINLRILFNIIEPLEEINKLIGMSDVKEQLVNQIIYFLRGYASNNIFCSCLDCVNNLPCVKNINDMLHTVITGPPGVGKTVLGKLLGKLYKKMEILDTDNFYQFKRSDLIGQYVGHTAVITQKAIDKCTGGVMFIDEAYSLGSDEKRDSFSKECIDTLNLNLSEKRNFMCIIAGYEKDLNDCFFSQNVGLERRFATRYNINPYTSTELFDIFKSKVLAENWFLIEENEIKQFFKNTNFPHQGGDIETFFYKCRTEHCKNLNIIGKYLTFTDVIEGYKYFDKRDKKYKIDSISQMYI